MLFPFINIMREENESLMVGEFPTKSLTEICADNLKHANYSMDTFFDGDL